MKRFMITPFEFGTSSGYDFLNNDNPEADIVHNPHVSFAGATTVFERSFRIWEPGRMALSAMGVVDPTPDQEFNVPQIPQGAKVHGIKGTLIIQPAAVAEFFDAVTGESLDPQPLYRDIFDPWNGVNTVGNQTDQINYRPGFSQSDTTLFIQDPQRWARCPFFIAMYKGTYNPYGSTNAEGGNIDSGPNDDPDTLLGVDITNPTVLEQERIVWWDMEMCTVPHRQMRPEAHILGTDGTLNFMRFSYGPWSHTVTKYNLSLDRNWIVRDDQVLWLVVKSGIVDTGFFWSDGVGNVHRIMYQPAFNVDIVASMLASPFTPGV